MTARLQFKTVLILTASAFAGSLILAACGSSSLPQSADPSGQTIDPGRVVMDAVDRTMDAESGTVRVVKSTAGFGLDGEIVIEAQFDSDPTVGATSITLEGDLLKIALASLDVPGLDVEDLLGRPIIEVRTDDRYAYMLVSLPSGSSDSGWSRVSLTDASLLLSNQLGVGFPFGLVTTPHLPILEIIQAADPTLTRTGESRSIDGDDFAGYIVLVDSQILAPEALSSEGWSQMVTAGIEDMDLGDPIELLVWVSEAGEIRRVEVDLSDLFDRIAGLDIAPPQLASVAGLVQTGVSLDVTDIGFPTNISFPDPGEVTDADLSMAPGIVAVGDCLPNGASDATSLFVPPETVDCSESHIGEIYGILDYPDSGGVFPGDAAVQATADSQCFALLFDYLEGPQSLVGAQFMELSPTEQTWSYGDRSILCLLIAKEPRTGSLKAAAAEFGFMSGFDLEPGTCFPTDDILRDDYAAPVSCAEPHAFEVVSAHVVDGSAYPGDEELQAISEGFCEQSSARFILNPDDSLTWLKPVESTWDFGDRGVFCIVELGSTRTGPLERAP